MNGDVHNGDGFGERDGECAPYAEELTRIAFGEVTLDAASAELQRHVRTCCACAELLRDATLLVPAIGDALRPTALSARAIARVESALGPPSAAKSDARRLLRLPSWRIPLAAAAAIALAVFWHGGLPVGGLRTAEFDAERAADVALSPDDAADLTAAFGLVQWADVLELSVARADSSVDHLEQSLDRGSDAQTLLPWSAEDDWDLPPAPAGSRDLRREPVQSLVSTLSTLYQAVRPSDLSRS